MAKKSDISLQKVAGFLAFTAIIIKGLEALINWILKLVGGSVNLGALTTIANLFILVAVFICAWAFVLTAKLPGKRIMWQVILFVITVLAILSTFHII